MKQVRYFLEAILLFLLMALFKIMPLDTASNTGGAIGRIIGPRLAASRKALRHLDMAMPGLSDQDKKNIITGMWDNLGRVMAEYPHLKKIGRHRVDIDDKGGVLKLLKSGEPCMMISGHLGNWEIAAATMLMQHNKALDLTYRAPNNPWSDKLLMKARTLGGKIRCYPKSRDGGQEIIKAMRERRYLAILIDQKYNEGMAVPFFGHAAMTNPVFVQLARKFDYPVIPARIERIKGANFKITLHPPLTVTDKTPEDVILQAHEHLESWIRQHPEQWLWLHRRWDSEKLTDEKEAA